MQVSLQQLRERLIFKGRFVSPSTVDRWLHVLNIHPHHIKHRCEGSNHVAVHSYITDFEARKVLAVFKAKHSMDLGHGGGRA